MLVIKKTICEEIISSYSKMPRDVKTNRLNGDGIWFYVYVENGNVYVESAKNHVNSSRISHRRTLGKDKVSEMLSLYRRRSKGEKVSQEAAGITHNQVYWYGIFADMNL